MVIYHEILTQNLLEQAHQVLGNTWIFQQDNDMDSEAQNLQLMTLYTGT
jgi:hypothetical protein